MESKVASAFLLTLLAGFSTGIGSLIAFYYKKDKTVFLSISLGFSAGIMMYISFVEILHESREVLVDVWGSTGGQVAVLLAFFGGILITALIDKLVPGEENPHHARKREEISGLYYEKCEKKSVKETGLLRLGIFTALVITIHNFPEGMAAFVAALSDTSLGITVALAVAIHNIPEGVAVSVPIYCATGDKKKALIYSFLSGFAEPVGALIGYVFLRPYLNSTVLGLIMGAVAGIMVFISVDELLPAAREYGEGHRPVLGFVLGMLVMAVSLIIIH